MEDLQKRHRQEQKDLQSRITQKKKSATKKTRKGINDECAELERQMKGKHQLEISDLAEQTEPADGSLDKPMFDDYQESQQGSGSGLDESIGSLSISNGCATSEKTKKPNRQKARLARRAAEHEAAAVQAAKEADDLPNLRAKEREVMQEYFESKGLKEQEIRSDGHCLYAAIADQLVDAKIGLLPRISILGLDADGFDTKPEYRVTREVAACYISANPDDFVPFLEEPLESYVQTIRETSEWGGHLELLALAKAYEVNINVLQGNGHIETIGGASESDATPLWLAYYRHSFGLGEHYNSLRQSS